MTVDPRDLNLQRSRLIDHFKRAYQIIVGLAITQACLKLFPDQVVHFPSESVWLFGIFFVTIVPIFHGGDRSLDRKYLGKPTVGWQQVGYIWDVYILLITAILFVKISSAMPGQGLMGGAGGTREHFYQWMGGMLLFDVAVLVVDGLKTGYWKQYLPWLGLNLVLGTSCLLAASASAGWVDAAVFVVALLRTVADYIFGKDFMFP